MREIFITLFVKKNDVNMVILLIYVDNMIVAGDDCEMIEKIKMILVVEFELKDL